MNLPVKPAGTQQSRIQNVRPVGGRQHDDPLVPGKAVHFHQQLVQGLLLLIVSAAQTGATLPAYRIDFVDKYNGRGDFLSLFKKVSYTASTYAHIHFHKIRAGNREELHVRLSGYRPGKEGLAGAGRAHQQQTVGNPGADFPEFFRIAQEIHDFLKLLLLLVRTGHVGEGDLLAVGHPQGRPSLAEVIQRIGVVGPSGHKAPGKQQHQPRKHQGQHQVVSRRFLFRAEMVVFQHPGVGLRLKQRLHFPDEPVYVGNGCGEAGLSVVGTAQLHGHHMVVHNEGLDLLIAEQLQHGGIGNLILALGEHTAQPGEYRD